MFYDLNALASPVMNFIRIFLFIPVVVVLFSWNVVSLVFVLRKKSVGITNLIFGMLCFLLLAAAGGIWFYGNICLPDKQEQLYGIRQVERLETVLFPNTTIDKTYQSIENVRLGKIAIEEGRFHFCDTEKQALGTITYSKNVPCCIQKMFLDGAKEKIYLLTFSGLSKQEGVRTPEQRHTQTVGNVQFQYRYIPDENILYVLAENETENIVYFLTLRTDKPFESDSVIQGLHK